jgi:hypothetical protein
MILLTIRSFQRARPLGAYLLFPYQEIVVARFRQMEGGDEIKDFEGIDTLLCGSIWHVFGRRMPKLNEIDIHTATGGYRAI